MEHLEWLLSLVANTAIIIFEFIGVGIINILRSHKLP